MLTQLDLGRNVAPRSIFLGHVVWGEKCGQEWGPGVAYSQTATRKLRQFFSIFSKPISSQIGGNSLGISVRVI